MQVDIEPGSASDGRHNAQGFDGEPVAEEVPQRDPRLHVEWFSRHGFFLHAVVLFVVSGCVIAAWWQTSRALGGNSLSWAYAFEWPCFAVYAVVLWWKLLHDEPTEADDEAYDLDEPYALEEPDGFEELYASGPALEERYAGEEQDALEESYGRDEPSWLGERAGSADLAKARSVEVERAARQGGWHP